VWELAEDGRPAEALGLARQVLAAEPGHFGALQAAAWLLEEAGDVEGATGFARRLIALFPGDVAGYWRMATLLFGQDRLGEAEPYLRKALEIEPGDAELHERLGTVLMDRLDWAGALAPMERAAAIEPENAFHLFRLGLVLTRLGRAPEAVSPLTAALDLGLGAEECETIVTLLETYGLPSPVRPVYRRACDLLGRPDLTVPGAAGRDKALLQAQAEIAERLAMPVGQDEATSRESWELARTLAECVLAGQRRNRNARKALEILEGHRDVPFALYSDPEAARRHGARLTELGRRFTAAGAALAEQPDVTRLEEVFAVAGELSRTFEAAGMKGGPDETEFSRALLEMVEELRGGWRPSPAEAARAARSFEASGLAAAFPAFHRRLTTGRADLDGHEAGDGHAVDGDGDGHAFGEETRVRHRPGRGLD
jgi:tetratricopeptide (TPR) repeat protein